MAIIYIERADKHRALRARSHGQAIIPWTYRAVRSRCHALSRFTFLKLSLFISPFHVCISQVYLKNYLDIKLYYYQDGKKIETHRICFHQTYTHD